MDRTQNATMLGGGGVSIVPSSHFPFWAIQHTTCICNETILFMTLDDDEDDAADDDEEEEDELS